MGMILLMCAAGKCAGSVGIQVYVQFGQAYEESGGAWVYIYVN